MKNLLRIGVPLIAISALAVTVWIAATLQAQIDETRRMLAVAAEVGVAGQPPDPDESSLPPTTTVHLAPEPMTADAARAWLRLSQPVDYPFEKETPLSEVLDFVRKCADQIDPKAPGLTLYVDPISLQEHERSLDSPVTCSIKGLPLSRGLTLLLKQLDLTYSVQDDGLVVINSTDCDDFPAHSEALMLDTLWHLRVEVAALRREVAAMRIGGVPATSSAPSLAGRVQGAICGGSWGVR